MPIDACKIEWNIKVAMACKTHIFIKFDQILSNHFTTQIACFSSSEDSVSPNICTIWGFPVLLLLLPGIFELDSIQSCY